MEIRLYNTLGRRRQIFKPIKADRIGIYSCGPTVYGNQHIGHMYAYVQWDVLVRFLRFLDFKVRWVMNITDVGHLTGDNLGDADTGEDKMEKGARREGLTVWQIAEKYIQQFLESADFLNITRPDILCRASRHIKEQIDLAKRIEDNGFTYRTKTGLVFDTAKFPDYARFARLDLKKQRAGERVEVDPEKKQPWDFLLWVTNQPEHIMKWDSPWGVGFPGWHIECTAMSVKYLGKQFDIHTGGQEHIGVHHTNEIAQGHGAYGAQTANFWLHNGWLKLEGAKISKSLGNVILVSDLIARGFDPLSLRYLILTSHYRQGLDFTWEGLKAASRALKRLRETVGSLKKTSRERSHLTADKLKKIEAWRQKFVGSLADDLAMPQALASIWEMLKSNLTSYDKLDMLLDFDEVLGLDLAAVEEAEIPEKIRILAEKRQLLRKEKKWTEADKVRKEIERSGFEVRDTGSSYWLRSK
ncbi:MAG: cysteine--tRNA ligase [Candidatus Pacebacteria bacterium]|nr:cysteine--tRNA ligase [Candidatus Paceibacterota bacterium]